MIQREVLVNFTAQRIAPGMQGFNAQELKAWATDVPATVVLRPPPPAPGVSQKSLALKIPDTQNWSPSPAGGNLGSDEASLPTSEPDLADV